jgi:hypothetical protein
MLDSRNIITTLSREGVHAHEGEGVPLMWNVLMDKPILELGDSDYHTVGYADNIAILISSGHNPPMVRKNTFAYQP